MNVDDYIAILSISVTVIIALIGGLYAIITNSKKHELAEQYTSEVLVWYEKVIMIVMQLADICDNDDTILRRNLLIQLSALIEVGRFYFPQFKLFRWIWSRKT